MIASTTSSQALFLPPATATRDLRRPAVVTGGVFAPNGAGVVDGDTVTVTGRWQWGSGTQHCQWILGGTRCDDDTFRLCWFAAADVDVPRHLVHVGPARDGLARLLRRRRRRAARPHDPAVRRPRPTVDVPLGAFPNFTLLAAGVAAVSLGIARRALDELVALADGQAAAVLVEDARPEPVHADRAGPRRGGAARRRGRSSTTRSAGRGTRCSPASRVDVPARVGIRLAGVNAAARGGRGRRHRLHARRRLQRLQLATCCSAACATPTSRPSTCRSRRSSTRRSAASCSASTSTPPPSDPHPSVGRTGVLMRTSGVQHSGSRNTRMVSGRGRGPRGCGGRTGSRAAGRRGRSR